MWGFNPGFLTYSSSSIECFFPSRVVGHLVNDQDVMHLKFKIDR